MLEWIKMSEITIHVTNVQMQNAQIYMHLFKNERTYSRRGH
jgi:hypothetical protein